MSEFSIKPNVVSIARSKRKFIYFGILLLIVNFYFVAQYVRLMLDEQSFGYYLFVLALVNLPIFVVSIVLLLVPTMHKHYYCGVSYVFKENALVIPNCVILVLLRMLNLLEVFIGFIFILWINAMIYMAFVKKI